MSKSTYYFEVNKVDAVMLRNKELMNEIQEIFNYNKGVSYDKKQRQQ